VCEQLAQGRYMKVESNPRPVDHESNVLTITPPRHVVLVIVLVLVCSKWKRLLSGNDTDIGDGEWLIS